MSPVRFPQERETRNLGDVMAGWLDGAKVALEGAESRSLFGSVARACASAAVVTVALGAAPSHAGQITFASAPSAMGYVQPPGPSHAFHQFAEKVLYANTGTVEGVVDFLESLDAVGKECASEPGKTCTANFPGLRMDYSTGRYEVSMTAGTGGFAGEAVVAREADGNFDVVDADRWDYAKGVWAYDVEGAGRSIGPE